MSSQSLCSAVVLLYPVRCSVGALPSRVRDSVEVWCFVAGLFCYYPNSGFAEETADRPAPAAAVSGASGLGAAPLAPAIYTPEYRKGQVEAKPLTERCFAKSYRFHNTVFFHFFMDPADNTLPLSFLGQNIHTYIHFTGSSPSDLHERNALGVLQAKLLNCSTFQL